MALLQEASTLKFMRLTACMQVPGTLKPAEYDRLLDAYRAEMIRYDRLDQELAVLEMPKKHISKELQRKRNEERRAKIIY